MHRVAFSVDDIDEALEIAARHDCHPLRGVATYEDVYKLTLHSRPQRHPRDARRGAEEELTADADPVLGTLSVHPVLQR